MSTPQEQYDAMLDECEDEIRVAWTRHLEGSKLLQEVDPIAYRCGLSDFQPTCDECGREYWADDPEDEAVCDSCRKEAEEALSAEEEDTES